MIDELTRIYDAVTNHQLAPADIRGLLGYLATGELDFKWHPLGFMHVKLLLLGDKVLRFHIWPKGNRKPQEPLWEIHDHNFSFHSYVVFGELQNVLYDVYSKTRGDYVLYEVSYYDDASFMRRTNEHVVLGEGRETRMHAGEYYYEAAADFHRTHVPVDFCAATLVAATIDPSITPKVVGLLSGDEQYQFDRSRCNNTEIVEAIRALTISM